ncbi:MAG TPA: transketolase C-terminal domain-containing protein [Gemmatimonadaceae bacterium]|nr:transketolase C-terminal domain-containing protein [Gemmatimonadaceae bacterium]
MPETTLSLKMGRATREAYGAALVEVGTANHDVVVVDADLAKSTYSFMFEKKFPERFYNIGIQEADMVSVASGLASSGKLPFISSFAAFMLCKGFDQLRMGVAYPHLNVKVAGSHGGISIGEDGVSQQSVEDIALACALPGFIVCIPADEHTMTAAVHAAATLDGPVFLRLGRPKALIVHEPGVHFEFGKAIQLRDGDALTIVANGLLVAQALLAAEELSSRGISARVLDMHTVKPIDDEALERASRDTGAFVVAEEQLHHGGLGSVVAASLAAHVPAPIEFVDLGDRYAESGSPEDLLEKYGMTAEHIVLAAERVVGRKG